MNGAPPGNRVRPVDLQVRLRVLPVGCGYSITAVKPVRLTYEQAASVSMASHTALQGLRDVGRISAGQRVLVNGASGGIGTFAVQLARMFGAEVTGVCSTRNLELVRSGLRRSPHFNDPVCGQ